MEISALLILAELPDADEEALEVVGSRMGVTAVNSGSIRSTAARAYGGLAAAEPRAPSDVAAASYVIAAVETRTEAIAVVDAAIHKIPKLTEFIDDDEQRYHVQQLIDSEVLPALHRLKSLLLKSFMDPQELELARSDSERLAGIAFSAIRGMLAAAYRNAGSVNALLSLAERAKDIWPS